MSEVGKRIAGVFIEDTVGQRPPVQEWMQTMLRSGKFHRAFERFISQQPESLDENLVCLEEIRPDGLVCRIPFCTADHESPHPFRGDVLFRLNPLTEEILRL
jgi:hypothetical protein